MARGWQTSSVNSTVSVYPCYAHCPTSALVIARLGTLGHILLPATNSDTPRIPALPCRREWLSEVRTRQVGEKREYRERSQAPRGTLRYFFAPHRWFPTPRSA